MVAPWRRCHRICQATGRWLSELYWSTHTPQLARMAASSHSRDWDHTPGKGIDIREGSQIETSPHRVRRRQRLTRRPIDKLLSAKSRTSFMECPHFITNWKMCTSSKGNGKSCSAWARSDGIHLRDWYYQLDEHFYTGIHNLLQKSYRIGTSVQQDNFNNVRFSFS